MKHLILLFLIAGLAQSSLAQQDSTKIYKKRVLENTEVDLLMSYYTQEGKHSPVSGGIGTESLDNITPTIVINLPLNDDDVLTIDAGLSAYTSASSSNINPFNNSGASRGGDDDEDEDEHEDEDRVSVPGEVTGSPWVASSGASRSDVLASISATYTHSSDDRNFIWGSHLSFSNEYDYSSIGFGGNLARLFNEKNTELSLKGQVYLDAWRPIYPTELHEYDRYGNNFLNSGYFEGVPVRDETGAESTGYKPIKFNPVSGKNRNSYSFSLSFSQILSKKLQASVFLDMVYQEGLLATPYHRIYFADRPNYYIGTASYIPDYTTPKNTGVYRLADDIERLPDTRVKVPVGARINYYINETLKLRTYYRYYFDDWGINSHTASLEIPVKLSQSLSIIPTYRFYTQTAADYFAPFETHLSTEEFYTSDYDLSDFHSNQYGIGLSYTDIFTNLKIFKLGMKNLDVRYNHYNRSDGLKANIISFGVKFILDKQ
ncbi:MAG: DUF3570 domain-containing protein [Mangrovibacterium sp.]